MGRISIENRKLIVQKYCLEQQSMHKIAKKVGCSESGVQKIIKKFGEHCKLEDMPQIRRRSGPYNPKKEVQTVNLIQHHKSMSVRQIARKVGVSVGTVQNIKRRNNLKTYIKRKIPKRSQKQNSIAKTRAGRLYKILIQKSRCILMDDETYVKMDTRTIPNRQYYTVLKGEEVEDSVKAIQIEKFGKKVLVWQAICTCGKRSKIYYNNGTITGENYRKECIIKRLLPLYQEHDVPPLFWPDLATAHYARETLKLLEAKSIDFVKKEENPPNCPELRPIERYWAFVKRHANKDAKEAKTLQEFKKIWAKATRKVDNNSVQTLMKNVNSKVRKFHRL